MATLLASLDKAGAIPRRTAIGPSAHDIGKSTCANKVQPLFPYLFVVTRAQLSQPISNLLFYGARINLDGHAFAPVEGIKKMVNVYLWREQILDIPKRVRLRFNYFFYSEISKNYKLLIWLNKNRYLGARFGFGTGLAPGEFSHAHK